MAEGFSKPVSSREFKLKHKNYQKKSPQTRCKSNIMPKRILKFSFKSMTLRFFLFSNLKMKETHRTADPIAKPDSNPITYRPHKPLATRSYRSSPVSQGT
jgi:hypothetical protein